MNINDFTKNASPFSYTSKERFWFENDRVRFWYRLYLEAFETEEWGNSVYSTRYQVCLVIDDESIHENHKATAFKERTCGFLLKAAETRGRFSEKQLEKVLDSALKLKIENKINDDGYQKVMGILNGTNFLID